MIAAFLPLLAIFLSVADSVSAHGYVQSVTVGGTTYPGWLPFDDPYKSPQPTVITRHVPGDGPIIDVKDKALACNTGGETGTNKVADAPAGGQITFQWNQWLADHLGPVSTYMASCNGDCTKFNTADAKWFKIDAAGYDAQKKLWASTQLINNGNKWTSTIPKSLASGEYLVRNEVIALHNADQPQFYPSCTQVKVTGGGSAKASGSSLVSIPGIYDNVKFPDIWADGFKSFTIPGPALFSSSGSSVDNGNSNSNDQAPPPVNAGSAPPSSSPTSSAAAAPSSSPSASSSPSSSPIANAPTSAEPLSSASPAASATGKCRHNKRRSDRMAKRHIAFAKRHH